MLTYVFEGKEYKLSNGNTLTLQWTLEGLSSPTVGVFSLCQGEEDGPIYITALRDNVVIKENKGDIFEQVSHLDKPTRDKLYKFMYESLGCRIY